MPNPPTPPALTPSPTRPTEVPFPPPLLPTESFATVSMFLLTKKDIVKRERIRKLTHFTTTKDTQKDKLDNSQLTQITEPFLQLIMRLKIVSKKDRKPFKFLKDHSLSEQKNRVSSANWKCTLS